MNRKPETNEKSITGKKAYNKPKLTVFGDIRSHTQMIDKGMNSGKGKG